MQKWKFLRDNKKVFFTLDCNCNIPENASEFLEDFNTHWGYFFFKPPDVHHIISGAKMIYIVLTRFGIRTGFRDGAEKHIFFPIEEDEETHSCKIESGFILINGCNLGMIWKGRFKYLRVPSSQVE